MAFHVKRHVSNFNPRSPRGERRVCDLGNNEPVVISIHAPLAGSDATS